MRQFLILTVLAVMLTGCIHPRPFTYKRDRVSAYLVKNPDVPGHINRALMKGEVVNGMTQTEVILCLGKPTKRESTTLYGATTEKWYYSQPVGNNSGLEHSRMWNKEVPLARVLFGYDGRVTHCQIFGRPVSPPAAKPDTEQGALTKGGTTSERKPPAGQRTQPRTGIAHTADSERQPVNTGASGEGLFDGWPELSMTGVSSGGSNPTAIINQQIVSVGETIDGVKVLEITPRGALLQYQGNVEFLGMQPLTPR